MRTPAPQPRVPLLTSAEIDQLEAHIPCQLSGLVHDFRLTLGQNGLLLWGHAHTYYAKQLAQQAVQEATSLPVAANEIEVA